MVKKELVKFRCTPLERAIIEKKAQNTGLSLSAYCRRTALGQKVGYRLTPEELSAMETLTVFHNNFARIANLLKERDKAFAKEVVGTARAIKGVLKKFQ